MSHRHAEPLIVASLRVPYQVAIEYILDCLREPFPDLRLAHLVVFQLIEHPPHGSRLTELAQQA